MKNIAIFYHCLFIKDGAVLPSALRIIKEQMDLLQSTGLLEACQYFGVGINGGQESVGMAEEFIPRKANINFHGLDSHNENASIVQLEQWLPTHQDWYVLYFHCKGATHPYDDYSRSRWRSCMTRTVINNWQQCVKDMDEGYDSVGCHWMTYPQTPKGQSIWAGTFFWCKSDFLLTLPSIMDRARIKESGLKASASRYEAEVWIGNGPTLPKVKDYHPNWNPGKVGTCIL